MYYEPKIDFSVLTQEDYFNPEILFIADTSKWLHLEDKPSIIEIQTPGSNTPVVNYFDKKAINTFRSVDLALNCPTCDKLEFHDLPDGVYNITLKASPSNFQKNRKYLRTTKARLELAKFLVSLNMGCESEENKQLQEEVLKISLLLDSAEANVVFDNIQTAHDEYKIAKDKIEKLTNCKECW